MYLPKSKEIFAKLSERGCEAIRNEFNYYNEAKDASYVVLAFDFETRKDASELAGMLLAEPNLESVEFSPVEPGYAGRWETRVSYDEEDYERAMGIIDRVVRAFFGVGADE